MPWILMYGRRDRKLSEITLTAGAGSQHALRRRHSKEFMRSGDDGKPLMPPAVRLEKRQGTPGRDEQRLIRAYIAR
jgi:hypothetical protein